MNPRSIAHIGVAVTDLEAAVEVYKNLLGAEVCDSELVESQSVQVAHFSVGDSQIELLQATSDDGAVAKFIAKRGEGLHHVALWVDDIVAELARLDALGVALIDRSPRRGAGGHLVAFVHPKSARGVLVELTQRVVKSS